MDLTLSLLVEKLNLKIGCGEEKLGRKVLGGYVGDLLSDVIANSKEGHVWITRQSHQNIIAVASLKEHAGIILALGKEPETETLEKASSEGIPVMMSELSGFELSGKIYELMSSD
jgi:serine kinase of HPr protein (carbohydrate metabolism regulator)